MEKEEIDRIASTLNLARQKDESDLNFMWRIGYAGGMKEAIRVNSLALGIGQAILNVCDERYEFKKENY